MEVAGWFIGAGIGTVFTALYEGVKTLAGRPTKFKAQLEALELTLESFDLEVIHQIGRHNEAMGLPNEDVKALEEELHKGVTIINELSDSCLWNRIDSRYISQLVELNRSLNILERRLKLQSMRDVKETRHMMQILLIRLTLHQESPSRDAYMSLLLSTTRLLDIAPQEALDRIQTLDPLRNIASSSTDLQQFHGNGEIQGNFPTSSLQLDIAPQEALHQILTLDPMRNIASTSTDIRQFQGYGEIQSDFPTPGLPDIALQELLHHTATLEPVRNVASPNTDLLQFHVIHYYAGENITELLKNLISIHQRTWYFIDKVNGLQRSILYTICIIQEIECSEAELPAIRQLKLDHLMETLRHGHELAAHKFRFPSRYNIYKNLKYIRKMEKIKKTIAKFIQDPLMAYYLANANHISSGA